MADEQLVQVMVDAMLAARFAGWKRMVAGYKNADGSITMAGAGVGRVWARSPEDSRGGTAVWGSAAYANAPLVVGPGFDGEYEVKGADWLTASISFGEGARVIDQPPGMSELVPDSIPPRSIKIGRVEVASGLNFRVSPFAYPGGSWESDAAQSASSFVPGTANEVCWVKPYLDPDTNTISAVASTPVFGEPQDLDEADIASITLPAGAIPLGPAFTLRNGQTQLSTSRFADTDPRIFLAPWDNSGGGGGGTVSGVLPSTCEGRLTLTTAVPVTTSDVTAAGTLYFTPFRGNVVALYDGADWNGHAISELSLSLSGLLPHSLHDVFIYDNSSTPTLELTAWSAGATGSITGCTNANPPVVDSAAHGLSVDDIVTLSGVVGATGINGTFRVSAVTTDTFTLQTLAAANPGAPGAYSSGGTWYKANYTGSRATALTTLNGVYVKNGATSRRYVGTIRITATAGQTEDSAARRLVWNYAHRVRRNLRVIDGSNSSFNYSTTSFRAWRNNLALAAECVIGVSEDLAEFHAGATSANSSGSPRAVGVGIDALTTNSAPIFPGSNDTAAIAHYANYKGYLSAGGHRVNWLQRGAAAGTVTWYDGLSSEPFQSGLDGSIAA